MNYIKKNWKLISFIYIVFIYLLLVIILDKNSSTLIISYLIFFAITFLIFIGTTFGFLGVFLHNVTKKDSIALPFYRFSYKLKTKNVNVLAGYGLILLKNDEPDKAKNLFEEALSNTNFFLTEKALRANIAICYWKLNDIDKAISEYEKLLKEFGQESEVSLTFESIDEIITNNPYMFTIDFTTLGYLYILKEDLYMAELFSRVALKQSEEFAPALDNMGQIHFIKKDYETAKDYFNKALDLRPNMVDSNYYLALIYKLEGNIDKARELLNVASKCTINGLSTVTMKDIERELESC